MKVLYPFLILFLLYPFLVLFVLYPFLVLFLLYPFLILVVLYPFKVLYELSLGVTKHWNLISECILFNGRTTTTIKKIQKCYVHGFSWCLCLLIEVFLFFSWIFILIIVAGMFSNGAFKCSLNKLENVSSLAFRLLQNVSHENCNQKKLSLYV